MPPKKEEKKSPSKKKEKKSPSKKKEKKSPSKKEEKKSPSKKEEKKSPSKKEEKKSPSKKEEKKSPSKKEEKKGQILENNDDNDNPDSDVIEMNNDNFKSDYREIINTYNPSNNKTNCILTIYEAALIIGKRATQITYGADPVIEYNETDTPESIAIRELLTKKIPFIIKRQINNIIEYWKIDDMELDEEAISIYE